MIMKHCTKALGAGAVAILTLAAVRAEAANFYVRNCTDQKILVCSYAEHNEKMWIAATARNVEPGERRKFRCHGREKKGEHCKAFVAITEKGGKFRIGKRVNELLHAGTIGGVLLEGGKHVKRLKDAREPAAPEALESPVVEGGALPEASATIGTATAETGAAAEGAVAVEGGVAAEEGLSLAANPYVAAAVGAGVAAYAIARGLHKNNLCREIRKGTLKTGKKGNRRSVQSIEHPPTITDRYNHFDVKVSGNKIMLTLASGDQCR